MNQGSFNVTNSLIGNLSSLRKHYYPKANIKIPLYSMQPVALMLPQTLSKVLPITFAYVNKLVTSPLPIINRINAKGGGCRLVLSCGCWVHPLPVNFEPFHNRHFTTPIMTCVVWLFSLICYPVKYGDKGYLLYSEKGEAKSG